jgi:hypothetical protein
MRTQTACSALNPASVSAFAKVPDALKQTDDATPQSTPAVRGELKPVSTQSG